MMITYQANMQSRDDSDLGLFEQANRNIQNFLKGYIYIDRKWWKWY